MPVRDKLSLLDPFPAQIPVKLNLEKNSLLRCISPMAK